MSDQKADAASEHKHVGLFGLVVMGFFWCFRLQQYHVCSPLQLGCRAPSRALATG